MRPYSIYLGLLLLLFTNYALAQNVGINEDGSLPDASAILDIKSNDKGLLVPRLTSAQRTGIAAPATGLIVYDTTTSGFWYYDGSSWVEIASGSLAANTLDAAYDQGGAGAGRIITADGGVVSVQGTDGIEVTGTFGSGAAIGSPGAGTRMFFNPRKAAFRAGSVTFNQWDDANVGDYSIGLGRSAEATGIYDAAIGFGARATGSYSTAVGWANHASGAYSLALGGDADATGFGAVAIGRQLTSSGSYSFAAGYATLASGDQSTSVGSLTTASGLYSFSSGYYTIAEAQNVSAFGRYNVGGGDPINWVNTDPLFEVGNGTNTSNPNNAFTILKNGNVGLSTATPSATLDVVGTFQLVDGNEAPGRVLTSDALGNATWVTPATGGNTLDGAYDQGGPGAGRIIDADAGAVSVQGTDGFEVTGTYNSGASITSTGPGARMFYNPNKAAFRAGYAYFNEWDDTNIGEYSIALGNDVMASGDNCISIGTGNIISGDYAHGLGTELEATGIGSFALGNNCIANDFYSVVLGYNSSSRAWYSTAIGFQADANGWYSIALGGTTTSGADYGFAGPGGTAEENYGFASGNNAVSSANDAVALGYSTTASGSASFAAGYNTTASGTRSIAFGQNGLSTGSHSITMGNQNTASNSYSVAIGHQNEATAFYAIAMGFDSEASGLYGVAIGDRSIASGAGSAAFNSQSTASGDDSFAAGDRSTAVGNGSFAMGYFTESNGRYSAALNERTIAQARNSTAIGRYNVGAGNSDTWIGTDPLFEIGNGSSSFNTSNAFTVLKNGNTGIMNPTPDATLDVIGTFQLVDGTEGANRVLTSDANGNASWAILASGGGSLDDAYDDSGAGNGRVILATDGAVSVQGNDGLEVTGTYNSGATIGSPGAGVRMFFNPRTASFRAGLVTAAQWNQANVGAGSAAFGLNNTASGSYSAAFGNGNLAMGTNAVAMGEYSQAQGAFSVAMGGSATAIGESAIAMGEAATANGDLAVAFSEGTANGGSSLAHGKGVIASASYEFAVGEYNTTYTPAGDLTDRAFVVGNGTAPAARSNALILQKNGLLTINDEYTLPNTDGTEGQTLVTDGAGSVSWSGPIAFSVYLNTGTGIISGADFAVTTSEFTSNCTFNLATSTFVAPVDGIYSFTVTDFSAAALGSTQGIRINVGPSTARQFTWLVENSSLESHSFTFLLQISAGDFVSFNGTGSRTLYGSASATGVRCSIEGQLVR